MKDSLRLFFLLTVLGGAAFPALVQGQAGSPSSKSQNAPVSIPTTSALSPASTPSSVDSGPMPFSNEEANFYRRAWPIDKSHSIGALVLFGSVVVLLLFLLVRQMAKSGPRKPRVE